MHAALPRAFAFPAACIGPLLRINLPLSLLSLFSTRLAINPLLVGFPVCWLRCPSAAHTRAFSYFPERPCSILHPHYSLLCVSAHNNIRPRAPLPQARGQTKAGFMKSTTLAPNATAGPQQWPTLDSIPPEYVRLACRSCIAAIV